MSALSLEPELKLSFQEGTAPGATLGDRFDWMEKNGIVAFEPYGSQLTERVNEYQQLLRGRNIKVSAICGGVGGCLIGATEESRQEFDRSIRELLEAAGELGSTGVILVPAFLGNKPYMPHNEETRAYMVEKLREVGDYALKCNTSVILEPLNRNEAFFMRQVADAASVCRDVNNAGITCLGDFWHMTAEETSDEGAFLAAGKHLRHVHMASRGTRNTPGEDGAVDVYVDGFRGLKRINYPYYVSFECGCKGDRTTVVPAAVAMLRDQWSKA